MAHLDEREVLAKTIYAEARGESPEGQEAVGHVIMNRARENKSYWGGSSVKDVCLQPGQFECWNGKSDIEINEPGVYREIQQRVDRIYDGASRDPTGGSDHYNNPTDEGYPAWTGNCNKTHKIGNHQFYKSKYA